MRVLLLFVMPVALAVCATGGKPSGAAGTPAQYVVRPNIADPSCNRGRGVRLPTRRGVVPIVAAGTMADGSTLVALSDYGTRRPVALYSLTRSCELGRETSVSRPRRALSINAVTARQGGGALLAGTSGGRWVVGAVTRRGRVDSMFGVGGWRALPFRGEVREVVQERSGRIIVGGDNGGGGCCIRNWVAALSTHGHLEQGFGSHGRVELPTGEDSGVGELAIEPNGDILAKVGYGNMGCWGVALSMLGPAGRPVPRFAKRLASFWKHFGFGAFVGDVVVNARGFTLLGTGQTPCAGGTSFSDRSATGLLARFRVDGRAARRPVRFPSRLYGDIRAFRAGTDTVAVESPYADPTRVTITAFRADGSVDSRFGRDGRATIRAPGRADSSTLDIASAGPRTITFVTTRYGHAEIQLIRVRLPATPASRARAG